MEMSATDMEKLVQEKMWIVEREVNRNVHRLFKGGAFDRDDLMQEARLGVMDSVKWWHPERYPGNPQTPPDGWTCKAIQDRLTNYFWFMSRRTLYTLEEPSTIDNEQAIFQDQLPSMEDVDIMFDLSAAAAEFLRCLLNPPAELKDEIHTRWYSGKPQCKNIFPVLRSWLGLTSEACNAVVSELRTKCKWQCHDDRQSAHKTSTLKFSSSRE